MDSSAEEVAAAVLEVVPLAMHKIRREMRSQRGPEMSVASFRTLAFLNHHQGASLSDVAEHLGLTPPSVCKMIDGLVGRGLVHRITSPEDRRRIELALTPAGEGILRSARTHTQSRLAEMLASVTNEQLAQLAQSLKLLHDVFGRESEARSGAKPKEK